MRKFKRFYALILALVMAVSMFGATTAFAAESTDSSSGTRSWTFIKTESRTISTTQSQAGSTFMPVSTQIYFYATFTTGSNRIVAIRLHEYILGTDRVVNEWQSSNGTIYATVSVDPAAAYCFEYLLASGTSVTVSNSIYRLT